MGANEFIPTRRSLLSRLRSWDNQDSWRDFFDTYWRLIYSVAVKSGLNESDAQDVVQETILSVAQQMPQFKYDRALGSFKSWLMRITRRRIADQLRKQYRQAAIIKPHAGGNTSEKELEEIADNSLARLESIWEEEWRQQIERAALDRVKRRVKAEEFQMFDFYVLQRLPVRQVAAALGVSTMKVYLARHRIGKLLKEEVGRLEKSMA